MELTQKLESRRDKQGWNNPLKAHDETIEECLKYNKVTGVMHFFLLKKMYAHTIDGHTNIIRMKDAEYVITRHFPKKLVYRFLKEMEQFNLIKIKNKQNIILLK